MVKTKKIALMFPGQGSQYTGMGEEFLENNKSFKKYFDTSSRIIGEDLLGIINGTNNKKGPLDKTQYSQISIYSLSCAINDYIMDNLSLKRESIETVLGHSLGEYSALYSSRVYDYEQGAKLVAYRGRIMAEANASGKQGMMAAIIGSDLDIISNTLKSYRDGVFIANYNDYSQTVISGYREDVKKAMSELKKKGAKRVIPLKVSIASHCPLMKDASQKLEEFIEGNISFNEPEIKFLSTTEVRYIKKDYIKSVLVNQLLNPIRWVDSIEYLLDLGVKIYIEVGPGRVLSGLVKRIAGRKDKKDIITLNTDKWDDIKNLKTILMGEGIINEA